MFRKISASAAMLLAIPMLAMAQAAPAAPAQQPAKPAQQPAKPTQAKPSHPAPTMDQIKEAQTALTKAGVYKGEVNGMLDAATTAAIKKFQTEKKLKVNGHLDSATIAALKKV